MNYIDELNKYAERHGLNKAEMARMFDVTWQTYHNWTERKSLPKDQYDRAIEILASDGVASALIEEITYKLSSMSEEGIKASVQSVRAIYDLENKS